MRNSIVRQDLESILSLPLPWPDLDGASVLISGAAGFLASYMVETLLHRNRTSSGRATRVVCLVRNRERARERFSAYQDGTDLEIIAQDVCAPVNIPGTVDYVIHAASHASPKYYGHDPVGVLSPNVLGTHNLLSLAAAGRARGFLFFSSGEVYGNVPLDAQPIDEATYGYLDPMNVRSCYAESKRLGETMCVAWSHQHQVPVRIVRPFHVYGPGIRLDDGRVHADFLADVLAGRDIVMRSDGSATRCFCYLADAVGGFFTVLLKGQDGQAYNIGNDRAEVSMKALAELLAGLSPWGRTKVVADPAASSHGYIRSTVSRSCPSVSKARSIGWKPTTPLEAGLRRTVASLQGESDLSPAVSGTQSHSGAWR